MIIACPSCGTKYNIPSASIGAGRSVKCAKCGHKWHQEKEQKTEEPPKNTADSTEKSLNTENTSATGAYAAEQVEANSSSTSNAASATQTNGSTPQEAHTASTQQAAQENTQENTQGAAHKNNQEATPAPATAVTPEAASTHANLPALQEQIKHEKKTAFWQGIGIGIFAGILLLSAGLALYTPIKTVLPAITGFIKGEHAADRLKAQTPKNHGLVIDNIQRDIVEEGGFTTYIIKGDITNTNITQRALPNLEVTLLNEQGHILDQWRVQAQKTTLNPGEKTSWTCYFYNPPLAEISEYKVVFTQK